ncbi:hypothetical protein DBA26_14355 [Brucella canis]|uniref:Uncharacterized protein n=2 Tax=Brucella TaxID=234 RepID=A9M908_BRUC2|nr:Hypothetical protein, conserved [Brucella canis ATCC 23365]ACU47495.1 hypothetical protein BMI_I487 [Brucella microti CCM 4915]ATN20032.1 hypothetical protein CRN66_09325 [Brucella canis]EEY32164.1 predicted protein [Brucella suis bv. 3 str. 686]MXF80935.1 hypothetical protein [Brucella melitensis]CDL75897.1 unnamed protein product [Brucella canis str. Oliveri]
MFQMQNCFALLAGNANLSWSHCPTQNRFALLARNANLSWSHYPTQNRFALLLEMLYTTAKCVARWRFPVFCRREQPIHWGCFK